MKKPEKIPPLCPLIQSECVEDGCKFWLQMERRDIATGKREEYRECAFIVNIGIVSENSMAINRMITTIGSMRDETIKGIAEYTEKVEGAAQKIMKALPSRITN